MKNFGRFSTKRRTTPVTSSGEKRLLVNSTSAPGFYGSNNEQNVQNELSNSGASLVSPLSKSPTLPSANSLCDPANVSVNSNGTFLFPPESVPQTVVTRALSHNSKRNISSKAADLPKVADSIIIDFQKEPFQFYTREINSTWKRSLLQSLFMLGVCFFVPSPLLGIIILINEKGNKKRMKRGDRQREHIIIIIMLIMTTIKDTILVTLLLHILYGSPASNYEIAYSPIVFFWCLISFLFPLTIFYFANVNYVFGFVSDRKTLLRLVSQLCTPKAKEEEMKKVNDQEKYFHDNYEDLSSIKSTYDEVSFLISATPRFLWITAVVMATIICTTHSVIPLVFYDCFTCVHYTHSINVLSGHNKTIHYNIYRAVVGMSALNSLLVSIIAAFYFIYIILWNVLNLGEWKRFNSTEKDPTKTIINNGPQGIAMWWKIYQTLTFFSSSTMCVSVLISKMACVISLLLIVCQSLGLMYPLTTDEVQITNSTATLFLIDNVLLYLGLVIIGVLSLMVSREQSLAKEVIQLKKLNISYELSSMLNIEPEFVDKEQAVPVRLRALRGCLMLLQELSSTMDSVQNSTLAHWVIICCSLATLFVIPSSFVTLRHITLNIKR